MNDGYDNIRRLRDDAPVEPQIGGGEDGERDCPLTTLGRAAGIYYFIAASGELHEIAAKDLTPRILCSLFDGNLAWLRKYHPKLDAKGEATGDVNYNAAAAGLMRMAAARGIWDRETPLRGRGVWLSAERLVVHLGDRLLVGGKWCRPGAMIGGDVYPAYAAIVPPAESAATAEDGARLAAAFKLWRFREPIMAHLAFGWVSLAMLGAAPRWRAHFLATGERGCGKSWLIKLFLQALGPQARRMNNFTAAGIQQTLNNEGRALILDEAEGDATAGRVQQVIELLRQMSGDDGAVGVRGSSNGASRSFTVNSATALAAINPPHLLPQDRSRILVSELDAIVDTANGERAAAETDWVDKMSPRLRARMLRGWPRFNDALAFWRAELLAVDCDGRQADQFGALLAAADVMLHDAPPDGDSTRELIDQLAPVLIEVRATDREETDPQLALNRLFSRHVESWSHGSKATIGAIVEKALSVDYGSAEKALKHNGLRLDIFQGNWVLLVATIHDGMTDIFRSTRWRDGGWKSALSRLEGAFPWPDPVRFAGALSRAVAIPQRFLPFPEDGERRSFPQPIKPEPGAG